MAVMAYASLPLGCWQLAPTVIWSQWAIPAIASTVIIAVQSLTEELVFSDSYVILRVGSNMR